MISRCPSCGQQVKEDERLCASCGWDFVARKRAQPEPKPLAALPLPAQADEADVVPEAPHASVDAGLLPPSPGRSEVPAVETPPTPPPQPAPVKGTSVAPKTKEAPAARRGSPVHIAVVAGAAIGTVSVLAVYLLLRKDPAPVKHPVAGLPPFAERAAPAEVAAPVVPPPAETAAPVVPSPAVSASPLPLPPAAPRDESRPAASFSATPRVTLAVPLPLSPKPAPENATAPVTASPQPPAAADAAEEDSEGGEAAARRAKTKGPAWTFEGVAFDLLTARGVFAAKLSFLDADGHVVGETSTGDGGSFKIVLPPGGPRGYSLKIAHGDYTGRYLDEGDAAGTLREATPEERKILMQAGVRNPPWVGALNKSVRRDLGLVPRSPEEP